MFKNEDVIEKLQELIWPVSPWFLCIPPLCFPRVLTSFSGRPFSQVCSGGPGHSGVQPTNLATPGNRGFPLFKKKKKIPECFVDSGPSWVTCLPLNQSQWSRSWNALDSLCLGKCSAPGLGDPAYSESLGLRCWKGCFPMENQAAVTRRRNRLWCQSPPSPGWAGRVEPTSASRTLLASLYG